MINPSHVAWLVGPADQLEGRYSIADLWQEPDCPEELVVAYAPTPAVACAIAASSLGWGPTVALRYRDADHFAALAARPRVERRDFPLRQLGWHFDDERRCEHCDLYAYGDPRHEVTEDDDGDRLCPDCRHRKGEEAGS